MSQSQNMSIKKRGVSKGKQKKPLSLKKILQSWQLYVFVLPAFLFFLIFICLH